MKRRSFLAALSAVPFLPTLGHTAMRKVLKGPLQGVTRPVFPDWPLERCCEVASEIGIKGFDFISDPADWPTIRRFGMTVSMLRADYGGGISVGRSPQGPPGWHAIGLKEAQGEYLKAVLELIGTASDQGFPNVIVVAGSKNIVGYEGGAGNAVDFLNQVKDTAERRNITICMEILNSQGFQAPPQSLFDHMDWGVDVVKKVASPRVKILYDLFHAQLSEGHIVQSLRNHIAHIAHIHVGSVPDRHEIFREDELDYGFIGGVIAELKFGGYVTHEWSPSAGSDVTEDLRRSAQLLSEAACKVQPQCR